MKFCRKKCLSFGIMPVAISGRQCSLAPIEKPISRKTEQAPEKTVTATVYYNQSSYHVKTNANQKLLGYEGASQNVQTENLRDRKSVV